MSGIRVVVADDHPIVRAGLTALLSSLPCVEVVGVAATGREAVKEVVTLRPHVAVLDVQMPDLDGFAATRELARVAPEVAVLVLTMFDDDDSVFAAMRAGARGYLVKGAEQEEIARAIHAVASGEAIFGPGVAQRVLRFFSAPPPAVAEPFPQLTAREREILDLLAAGLSNTAIAHRLGVAYKTVANNISAIFTKLHVTDRPQAIVRARDAGLGSETGPRPAAPPPAGPERGRPTS
jgi:DNA-binding NarL/FixJ family response regulator